MTPKGEETRHAWIFFAPVRDGRKKRKGKLNRGEQMKTRRIRRMRSWRCMQGTERRVIMVGKQAVAVINDDIHLSLKKKIKWKE